MEDLIRNVHTLFDDQPSTSPSVSSPAAPSTFPSGSSLSADLLQPSEADATGRATRRLRILGVIPTSTHTSFSSLPSGVALESHLTPSPTALVGLPPSNILVEGIETHSQEQVATEAKGTEVVEPEALANSPPPEVGSVLSSSVAEWQLRQSQLSQQLGEVTVPQSPSDSVLSSSTSDLPLSSVMSL